MESRDYYEQEDNRKFELLEMIKKMDCKKQALISMPTKKQRKDGFGDGYIIIDKRLKCGDDDYFRAKGVGWYVENGNVVFDDELEYGEPFSPNVTNWVWKLIPREKAEKELMLIRLGGNN